MVEYHLALYATLFSDDLCVSGPSLGGLNAFGILIAIMLLNM